MLTVSFYSILRSSLGLKDVKVDAKDISVLEVLKKIEEDTKNKFVHKLVGDGGELVTGLLILLNGKNIFQMDLLDTIVPEGSTISVIPPGGGG